MAYQAWVCNLYFLSNSNYFLFLSHLSVSSITFAFLLSKPTQIFFYCWTCFWNYFISLIGMEDPDISPSWCSMPPTSPFPTRRTLHGLPSERSPSATSGSRYIDGQDHNHYNSEPQQHYHHYMQLPGPGNPTTPWPDRSLPPLNNSTKVSSQETKWNTPSSNNIHCYTNIGHRLHYQLTGNGARGRSEGGRFSKI